MSRIKKADFIVVSEKLRSGSLQLAWVLWKNAKDRNKGIVISVPRLCGSAVRRNRFRRIVRSLLSQEPPRFLSSGEQLSLWILVSNRSRLPWPICRKDVESSILATLKKLKIKTPLTKQSLE